MDKPLYVLVMNLLPGKMNGYSRELCITVTVHTSLLSAVRAARFQTQYDAIKNCAAEQGETVEFKLTRLIDDQDQVTAYIPDWDGPFKDDFEICIVNKLNTKY